MTTSTIDRIRQLRQDALDAKAEINNRINEQRSRITEVCRSGTIPFDEAWGAYKAAFEGYADQGRQMLERSALEFTRPNHDNPTSHGNRPPDPKVSEPFMVRQFPNGLMHDIGPLIAHLNRDAILAEAQATIKAACKDANVPPAADREKEIERLAGELQALEDELADVEDELSELFGGDPSERTKEQRRRDEKEQALEIFNKPIRERNERNAPPPPAPNPITVRDEDGRDVDDPAHGPAVRRTG